MPVVKYEKNFGELVDSASERKIKSLNEWNNSLYELYGSNIDPITEYFNIISKNNKQADNIQKNIQKDTQNNIQNNSENSQQSIPINSNKTKFLKYSSLSYMILNGPLVYPRSFIIFFAILTLVFRLSDSVLQDSTTTFTNSLDLLINFYFIFEGFLRLFTVFSVFEIRKRCFEKNIQPLNSLFYEILRSGWIEILISLLSIAISSQYDSTNAICWFNLFRLSFIANFFILELPQIEVLLSGIYSGLRSIIATWFLLIITFVIYGVLATASFRTNDPGHFSTVGTSMFTLFRISTMDNWSQINYINAYGCDSVPSEYSIITIDDPTPRYVDVISGRMYLFLCDSPEAHPYLSSFIFTSFVVFTGFMLISLTVAAVSGGVHLRLEQIQKQELEYEKDLAYDMENDLLDNGDDVEEDELQDQVNEEIDNNQKDVKINTINQNNSKPSKNNRSSFFGQNKSSTSTELLKKAIKSSIKEQDNNNNNNNNNNKSEINNMWSTNSDIEAESDENSINSKSDVKKFEENFQPALFFGNMKDSDSDAGKSDDTHGNRDRLVSIESYHDVLQIEHKQSESDPDCEVPAIDIQQSITNDNDDDDDTDDEILQVTIRPVTSTKPAENISPIVHTQSNVSETIPTNPISPSVSNSSPKMNKASRKTIRSLPSKQNSTVKEKLPLLEDKDLIRMMIKQMWSDVNKERELKREEELSDENNNSNTTPRASSTQRSSTAVRHSGSTTLNKGNTTSFRASIKRSQSFAISFRHDPTQSFHSKKNLSYFFRNLLLTYYYIGYIIFLICITAAVEIYCTNKDNCRDYWTIFVVVQILLTFDIVIRIFSHFPTYKSFFYDYDNIFDFLMVSIIWIPSFYTGYGSAFAESCRIAYLLRLLPLLSWITDLQIIMLSIESSLRPVLYVVGMMFLMFFHFAVAGVLIFKRNDEFYFGTLYRAMNTLFQVCTLDNWGNVALKNMYGCDYYGYPSGIEEVDAMCNSPLGLGWIAAWYFLVFITLSVMVLQSLFVGIIISAMELLKDSVVQEASMWKLIYQRVDKYGLQNSTLVNLLEIFDALDAEKNGLLTEKELEPLLAFLPQLNISTLFFQVGSKIKGHVNPAEFIDLIYLIGVRLNAYHPIRPLNKVVPMPSNIVEGSSED